VREIGVIEAGSEVEAVAVDDALGFVYYAEEPKAIHKWHADPDHPRAAAELARLGTTGFRGDREGLAVYGRADGTGYLVATDQIPGASRYLIFRREGAAGASHDHSETVTVLEGGADATDGLDATAEPLGPAFPRGLVVAMNSRGRNFVLYRPEDLGFAPSSN
jgi:3-phytase